ncbi:TatD family nuclease-associated radical SAM protein [Marinobacterium jannaschii]|uniref:TatD family nuclease-associated radical SAM protein n=1 Tax=Marinobacterium jannaschii TaxID=64970 RepID=UPI000686FDEB|nr:TatD family nuclease-associated radical SAM protein [Marinobacterium jannaschii]
MEKKLRPNPAKRSNKPNQESNLVYQIEDKLYVNLTDRCTLACSFCPKHNGCTEVKGYELYLAQRPQVEEIIRLLGDPSRFSEIVFCGFGEPTLRLQDLLQIARYVKQNGGKTRLNTDGLGNRVHKRDITSELASCIDALSISLNAQDEATYTRHCKPSLTNSYASVLDFIEAAASVIDDVAVSAISGLEGVDIEACRKLTEARGARFKPRYLDVVG